MGEYAVVDRPGYFGNNKAIVRSSHRNLTLAVRAMKRHYYTDDRGQKRHTCCVVKTDKPRGAVVWGDMFPEILA